MVAIKIRNLGKYYTGSSNLNKISSTEAWNILLRIIGFNPKPKAKDGILRTATISGWVLRDVNLNIEQGSIVCLTGASGAGKSVFLKLLSGVISPTTGSIEFYGSVNSLLSIGDNLDSRLTAIENIENYLKFKNVSVVDFDAYVREVIGFAELEGFEHIPVRTYSTGMTMRLSISLALQGDSSIILVDDVLGVGDIGFQQKCIERLLCLKRTGCTMVLALSDEILLRQIATQVIGLNNGQIIYDGSLRHRFVTQGGPRKFGIEWQVESCLPSDEVIDIQSVTLSDGDESGNDCISLCIKVNAKVTPLKCRPSIIVMRDKIVVFRSLFPHAINIDMKQIFNASVDIPGYLLSDGRLAVSITIQTVYDGNIYSLKAINAAWLTITREAVAKEVRSSMPLVWVDLSWDIENISNGVTCVQKQ